ncbi:MAG: 2-phospho-L-lactate transferase [Actinomycetota bacterium]
MKVTALAGGVGGAKLVVGLQRVTRDSTAIVNTGDDTILYGVRISPDVDIVTYWCAGIADTERGWGIRGDSFHFVEALGAFGGETWFSLGDRDFATCRYRTDRLAARVPLGAVTDEIRRALGATTAILPMTDDDVATQISTSDGRELAFQEYFVRERCEPDVAEIHFAGIEEATPSPGVIDAIERADVVIICPSNPLLSIAPILGIDGIRTALRAHPRVIAVTPIVQGRALKGPADRLLAQLGYGSSASGVARLYADFCDVFVIDDRDSDEVRKVEALGIEAVLRDTIMSDHAASERLARELVDG